MVEVSEITEAASLSGEIHQEFVLHRRSVVLVFKYNYENSVKMLACSPGGSVGSIKLRQAHGR